MINIMLVKLLL